MRQIFVMRDGRLVPKEETGPYAGLTIIRDTPGCVSPITRTWIEGRTQRREHMKRHGVVEADPSMFRNKGWQSPKFQRRFGQPRD